MKLYQKCDFCDNQNHTKARGTKVEPHWHHIGTRARNRMVPALGPNGPNGTRIVQIDREPYERKLQYYKLDGPADYIPMASHGAGLKQPILIHNLPIPKFFPLLIF